MPHHKSYEKSIIKEAALNSRNRSTKSRVKTLEKNFRQALSGGDKAIAGAALVTIQKALDQAASHGILKPNTVARKKSRLMKALNQSS